ncbi:MAG TPA: IS3 family transposase [Firmicutes bacterium]|nr:IS3 family transposase [Bacillota bacterium]
MAAGKLYLSPILDMHNREIVAFNISRKPNFNQTTDMSRKAFAKYEKLEGLIFHSDQGWQYQMKFYHEELKKRGIEQSMPRKGNCLDNSPMENFFEIVKNEMFYGHECEFKSLDELEKAMNKYIEYYNSKRIMEKTKGLSPLTYRQQPFAQL